MSDSVLVVAAHPDDEVLGCGGAMAKHASEGDAVSVLILAEGATSRDDVRDVARREADIEGLRESARKAASELGVADVGFGSLPDNRMDSLDLLDVVKIVEASLERTQASIVYTHHAHDLNVDHQVTARAALTACRPLPGVAVRRVLQFETLSSTEWQPEGAAGTFCPNWYVDIESTLEAKLRALTHYASEMRPEPHARSIEAVKALAARRGYEVGCHAAEAFSLARSVERGR